MGARVSTLRTPPAAQAPVYAKQAYSIQEAAEQASVSEDTLRKHIQRGLLDASYPSSKPIIRATELQRWLDALPTERPA